MSEHAHHGQVHVNFNVIIGKRDFHTLAYDLMWPVVDGKGRQEQRERAGRGGWKTHLWFK